MKTKLVSGFLVVITALFLASCGSNVTLTSWKNPQDNSQISKVVVIPLFDRLDYMKPFEQSLIAYFSSQGLKSIGSLDFLNPSIKYPTDVIQKKVDSLGADAVLIFKYTGTDKSANYVPPTYWGGFGGYWGYGGYWGGGAVSGGYWTTTSTVNLKALLYTTKNTQGAVWTADVTVTDPNYVDQAATTIAQDIFADWQKNNLLKYPATGK
jgi:hypothetical protein